MSTQPTTPSAAITVDIAIPDIVLTSAQARLPFVQALERQKFGKHLTNLSTLAERILTTWHPGQTVRPELPPDAECPSCGKTVGVYMTGKLRVHGPAGARCPTSFVKKYKRVTTTRPLRFPMNREEYEAIAQRIREGGESVAGVVSQRLSHFAKTGSL